MPPKQDTDHYDQIRRVQSTQTNGDPDKDRKYAVAQLTDEHGNPEYWVNLVHTYGVASAQHYSGRTAACFVRLQYHLSDEAQYVFVFVDDYSLLVKNTNPVALAAHLLLLCESIRLTNSLPQNPDRLR
jgi:hypothetical protein